MPGLHGGTLAQIGPCAYCETRTDVSCRLCGRAICPQHEVEDEQVCLGCLTGPSDD